ncbi:MAG: hypothetical protein V4603_08030, partial [Pseudomonadota bacterium]
DVMFLLPFLAMLFGVFVGFACAAIALVAVGFALVLGAIFPGLAIFGFTGGLSLVVAVGLAGAGLMAIGVGLGALFWLVLKLAINALVEYARLHFRLINTVTA